MGVHKYHAEDSGSGDGRRHSSVCDKGNGTNPQSLRRAADKDLLRRIPRSTGRVHYTRRAIRNRLDWAEAVTGAALDHLQQAILDPERLAGNIENYIGAVQVPVGLAGPVRIKGRYAQGSIPVPIATTEGALVSSITRGAIACSLAGGIEVQVKRQQMIRAPVFFCADMAGAVALENWVNEHLDEIRHRAERVSSVAKLIQLATDVFGDTLHLRFYYTTGDAAGQNMTTACTWSACEWIADHIRQSHLIGFRFYNIEGNMSGDKKACGQSFTSGRGVSVTAACFLPERILQRILHITSGAFLEGWQAGEVGALQVGMVGSNVNFANVIAGIYTATGQDIASVHESSLGIFKVAPKTGGLYVTASLPSLVIGTVGGGTGLPTQRECLELMGCAGPGHVFRMAEIIAATCLALDLSTAAAIGTNEFVAAHERLGRNRYTGALTRASMDARFFEQLLHDKQLKVRKVEKIDMAGHSGIITKLERNQPRVHGIHKYRLHCRSDAGESQFEAILKLKNTDEDLVRKGTQIAKLSGEDILPGLFEAQAHVFGFDDSHIREIECYHHAPPALRKFMPEIYGTRIDSSKGVYAILMEDLAGASHIDSANTPASWSEKDIHAALSGMADFHALYFDRAEDISRKMHVVPLDEGQTAASGRLLSTLTRFNAQRYPHLVTDALQDRCLQFIRRIDAMIATMKDAPMTLVHNDFNPRNLCFRRIDQQQQLVLYDWELASFQNPQRDLIEFLVFVLPQNADIALIDRFTGFYISQLEKRIDATLDPLKFERTLRLNALFTAVVRFNLYLLAHNVLRFDFMDRVYTNLANYIVGFSMQDIFNRP